MSKPKLSLPRWRELLPRLGLWTATAIVAPILVGVVLLVVPGLLGKSNDGSRRAQTSESGNFISSTTAKTTSPSIPASSAHRGRTLISLVDPWDVHTEIPSDRVIGRSRGSCVTISEGDFGNPAALRCVGPRFVYDPCFANIDNTKVACPEWPWRPQVILLAPSKRLPIAPGLSKPVVTSRRPWGVALANGDRCIFDQGAGAPEIDGLRLQYLCARGSIIGEVSRKASIWIVNYVAFSRGSTREVGVVTAWY